MSDHSAESIVSPEAPPAAESPEAPPAVEESIDSPEETDPGLSVGKQRFLCVLIALDAVFLAVVVATLARYPGFSTDDRFHRHPFALMVTHATDFGLSFVYLLIWLCVFSRVRRKDLPLWFRVYGYGPGCTLTIGLWMWSIGVLISGNDTSILRDDYPMVYEFLWVVVYVYCLVFMICLVAVYCIVVLLSNPNAQQPEADRKEETHLLARTQAAPSKTLDAPTISVV